MTIPEKDKLRMRALAEQHPRLFKGALLPWYTVESWAKMRAAASDRNNLHDTFEEFERDNAARIGQLAANGTPMEKIVIDVDNLIKWCKAEGRPLDASARNLFTFITVTERDKGAGHA